MYDPALLAMFREDHASRGFNHLPAHTLTKIACGMGLDGQNAWIDKFKGTELFDQAFEIEQEKLKYETARLQNQESMSQLYSAEDQLRLKRRMLELSLAKAQQMASAPAPMAEEEAPAPEMPPAAAPVPPEDPAKLSAPLALLRLMSKTAAPPLGIGAALMHTATRNPGAIIGGLGGGVVGGVRGAQTTIDPATGQPVGGGVLGAAKGALLGTGVGAAGGLLAQGVIRSGAGAYRNVQHMAEKGLSAPGGYVGQLGNQALSRANAFAGNVQMLGKSMGAPIADARKYMSEALSARRAAQGAPTPIPASIVAPPTAITGV